MGSLLLAIASPAAAQVYQIDDGGALQVRSGGGVVSWRAADAAQSEPSVPAKPPVAAGGGSLLEQAAAQAGLHPALLEALVWQESRWHPDAVSPRGAVGLTQLMPATARDLGVDPHDPVANLFAGARHLRSLIDHFNGDLTMALAAYNAGARRVEHAGGIPPFSETQNYVRSIMTRVGSALRNH